MDDVAAALISWSNGIANAPGRQVRLLLFWDSLGSGVLGESYNLRGGNGTTSWTYAERVWRDGANFGASYDGRIVFGTGVSWSFGAALPAAG
jgi:hypothetical protein